MTKCASLSEIEKIDIDETLGKEIFRKTSKDSAIKTKVHHKAYRGRFSLGKTNTATARVHRRKSFNRGGEYLEDEDGGEDDSPNSTAYTLSPSASQSGLRCIPVIERATSSASTSTESRTSCDSLHLFAFFRLGDNELPIVDKRKDFYDSMCSFMSSSKTNTKLVFNEKEHKGRIEKMFTCTVEGHKPKDHNISDVLWLMLKAYFAGREGCGGQEATFEEDSLLYKRREQHWNVIEDVGSFTALKFPKVPQTLEAAYMTHVAQTRENVFALLERLDHYQSLFPTRKAMLDYITRKKDVAFTQKFGERVDVLMAWLNTVDDLFERIQILGTIFEVDHLPDAANIWPRPMGHSQVAVSLTEARPVFSEYVGKNRNLKAMKKVLVRVWDVCETALVKAALLLNRPPGTYAEVASGYRPQIPITEQQRQRYDSEGTSVARIGVNSEQFQKMELPSFQPIFVFILGVRLELILEWLSFRSSFVTPFDENVDGLTLSAIIEDSRDCLEEAIGVKLHYLGMMHGIGAQAQILEEFDNCLKDVFKKYLDYVSKWSMSMACSGNVTRLFDGLMKEWTHASGYARSIRSGIEDLTAIYSSQVPRLIEKLVLEYWEQSADHITEEHSTADILCDEYDREEDSYHAVHNSVLNACREHQRTIRAAKDRIKRIITLLKDTMLKDLNDCAGLALDLESNEEILLMHLKRTHAMVRIGARDNNLQALMFVHLSNMENAQTLVKALCENRSIQGYGHLLVVPYPEVRDQWKGRYVNINIDDEAIVGLKHLRNDLILLTGDYNEKSVFPSLERQVAATSSNDFVSDNLEQLSQTLVEHSGQLWTFVQEISNVYEHDTQSKRFKDTILSTIQQAFDLVFEVHRDLLRIIGDSHKFLFGHEVIRRSADIVCKWNELVKAMNPNPTPDIPVWALLAFSFIYFIGDPKWTCLLDDNLLEEFIEKANECRVLLVSPEAKDTARVIGRRSTRTSSFVSRSQKKVFGKDGRRGQLQEAAFRVDNEVAARSRGVFPIGRVIEMAHNRFDLAAHMDKSRKPPFKWQLIKRIGSGTFAEVYKSLNLDEKCVIAVKKLRVEKKVLPVIEREIDIFRGLNHENLVKYYGFQVQQDDIYILMEYCAEGTLERICRECMDMTFVRMYTNSLLKAISYLHRQPVVHRDIKPANIFLDLRSRLKLGDFGCSVRLQEDATVRGELAEYAGTPQYMAPEVQTYGGKMDNGQYRGYGRAVDIWSLGCVVLQMSTGRLPWPDCQNHYQITMRVCSKEKPPYPHQAPAILLNFLDSCFEFEPDHRKTAEELLQDPFANVHVDVETVYASSLVSPGLVPADVLS